MSIDPWDLFVSLNPLGLDDGELEKDSTGFADQRAHGDYLVFLGGYKAGTVGGEQRKFQRHRPVNAEGCKPETDFLLSGVPCAGAAVKRGLDKAEGCKPDINIHPTEPAISPTQRKIKIADNELMMAQVSLLAAVRAAYPAGSRLRIRTGQHTTEVVVKGHIAAWWSRPDYIQATNPKTGKSRTFHHGAVVEALP
ncbi:MAG: hypothetical protein ABS956_08850 [Pseudomonas sp.]|uniref:hypothetical protein n=1 Tax=Pseudomonas sp. TaxID=306 RepID=UPI0033155939